MTIHNRDDAIKAITEACQCLTGGTKASEQSRRQLAHLLNVIADTDRVPVFCGEISGMIIDQNSESGKHGDVRLRLVPGDPDRDLFLTIKCDDADRLATGLTATTAAVRAVQHMGCCNVKAVSYVREDDGEID